MRGTLLGWFIVLALVPMLLVSIIFYYTARNALTDIAIEKLVEACEMHKDVIQTLVGKW